MGGGSDVPGFFLLKVAVWDDERIVRDRTRARDYDLRSDYLDSVRRGRLPRCRLLAQLP